eukprot:CAMPEP_0172910882 /NCGR_PEP_ID=MMETSP1075-20121228/185470_1 /TAXON_ID=2916 /ORGANISM="Ceratium fusus, Strain PA161109" /LENGTH=65 /DNA_ID=CAMNT_0013769087 /DNA_START=1 /DNA_END=195 /DNA_ORIENTATION=+
MTHCLVLMVIMAMVLCPGTASIVSDKSHIAFNRVATAQSAAVASDVGLMQIQDRAFLQLMRNVAC